MPTFSSSLPPCPHGPKHSHSAQTNGCRRKKLPCEGWQSTQHPPDEVRSDECAHAQSSLVRDNAHVHRLRKAPHIRPNTPPGSSPCHAPLLRPLRPTKRQAAAAIQACFSAPRTLYGSMRLLRVLYTTTCNPSPRSRLPGGSAAQRFTMQGRTQRIRRAAQRPTMPQRPNTSCVCGSAIGSASLRQGRTAAARACCSAPSELRQQFGDTLPALPSRPSRGHQTMRAAVRPGSCDGCAPRVCTAAPWAARPRGTPARRRPWLCRPAGRARLAARPGTPRGRPSP